MQNPALREQTLLIETTNISPKKNSKRMSFISFDKHKITKQIDMVHSILK